MKKIIIAIYYLFFQLLCFTTVGQQLENSEPEKKGDKSAISIKELGTWPYVSKPKVSSNGKFVTYRIINYPAFQNETVVIKSINNGWRKEYPNVISEISFSSDDQKCFWIFRDTLFIQALEKDEFRYIAGVKLLKQPKLNKGDWIAYKTNNELFLYNLKYDTRTSLGNVDNYLFDDSAKAFIYTRTVNDETTVHWVDLLSSKQASVLVTDSTAKIDNIVFDRKGTQIVFNVINIKNEKSIWYYRKGDRSATVKVDQQYNLLNSGLRLHGNPEFSVNGNWIFFTMEVVTQEPKRTLDSVNVNIWSYKDLIMQPDQMRGVGNYVYCQYVINVQSECNKLINIQHPDESVVTGPKYVTGDFVVIRDNIAIGVEYWWRLSPQPSIYLVSLKDGSRRLIKKESNSLYHFSFSPNGKYLVYWDTLSAGNWFSYDVEHGACINMTKRLPVSFVSDGLQKAASIPPCPIVGWFKNEKGVIISDNYDLWIMDPSGRLPASNVTQGVGRLNKIRFWPIRENDIGKSYDDLFPLILTAFNEKSKYNGFYKLWLTKKSKIEALSVGPFTYYHVQAQTGAHHNHDFGMQPIKANKAFLWVIKRQSAVEAPNFYWTVDFKIFNPISNLQPQKNVNWIRTELIDYKKLDGSPGQAILYKPENFDPGRKYPVILNYYRNLSQCVFQYPYPKVVTDNIDIPYFVSNGYIICTPDVRAEPDSLSNLVPGERSLNSVMGIVNVLKRQAYIDSFRIGLQGHSWGGQQTNYLVTHTSNVFAAAAEFAGVSDPVSSYLTLIPFLNAIEHSTKQPQMEEYMTTDRSTLWDRPDLYLKNSSVLNADKVTTPVLITHNPKDNNVQYRQGIELYLSLRRLGRKCWLLEYPEDSHTLTGKNAIDYTIRLTQFFNYYLKETLPPLWMTKGVPVSLKGKIGYELDSSGAKP